jgi:hypothetical protein
MRDNGTSDQKFVVKGNKILGCMVGIDQFIVVIPSWYRIGTE